MKKIISIILIAIMTMCTVCTMTGCGNRQFIDVTYKFKRVLISLPNGTVVDGIVDSWTDFEDGDQIQVKVNGVTYLTHMSNVCLMTD